MKKLTRVITLFLTIAMLTFLFAGCQESSTSSGSSSDDKVTINLGIMQSSADFIIANEKGFFEEKLKDFNTEIKLIPFTTGAEVTAALASGDVDLGIVGDQPALAAIAADYGVKNIALSYTTESLYGFFAGKDSGIESLDDLKGKKIGTMLGTTLEYLLYQSLDYAGISKDEVEIINSKDISTLLASGEIDVAFYNETGLIELIHSGDVYTVASGEDLGIFATTWIVGREGFTEEYPEITADLLEAVESADTFISENPDDTIETVVEYAQVSELNIQSQLKNNDFGVNISDEAVEAAGELLEFLQESDLVENKDIKIEDTIDYTYLELAGLRSSN